MSNHVFIPTRGRHADIKKLVNEWMKHGFQPHLVVEPSEIDLYKKATDSIGFGIHPLEWDNQGIGNARAHCVNLAASFGYKSIILADDDIKPSRLVDKARMLELAASARHKKVLGITARYSYHDLCLGSKITDRDDVILLPTGTFRLVALNVANVLDIGNYDKNLEYAEDCDLFLRGLEAGFPWMVHLGTWSNSIGKRYQPGGMLAFAGGEHNLEDSKKSWHETLYDKYPMFINDPEKADFTKQNSIRISWRKAYDHYLPDWRKWSMLQGGDLSVYTHGE